MCEEEKIGGFGFRTFSAEEEDAEFIRTMDVRKNRGLVLEIIKSDEGFGVDQFAEEFSGGMVGCDAGGYEQSDTAAGGDE